ncbi:MAG TPA: hypothetical protein VLB46_16985 [Pyrinomonadaceae bacterium]|nr:hypothetical protein [Pyrinomonadaceae bacterium]
MKILTVALLWASLALPYPSVAQQPQIVTAAQVNGTWQSKFGTFRILALGKQRLRVEFEGAYFYRLADGTQMAHTGEGSGIATIEGNEAAFKPKDAEEGCEIRMKFIKGKLEVKQEGSCGFGHNVSAEGTYRRVSSRKPKFGFPDR